MKADILQFVALADQSAGLSFSRQTHAKCTDPANAGDRVFDIVTPVDPASGYGQWKHVKNAQGWPWDLKLYDAHWVYDWITEKDWTSGPRSFKKFIQNHTRADGVVEDGLIMFPRYVDSQIASFSLPTAAAQTMYATFDNCVLVGAPESLGIVRQQIRGPFQIDHGGDVGTALTYIHQYYWLNVVNSQPVPTLEENCYALNYGWVSWKLQTLNVKTGMYELKQQTISNRLVAATPVIQFPCF